MPLQLRVTLSRYTSEPEAKLTPFKNRNSSSIALKPSLFFHADMSYVCTDMGSGTVPCWHWGHRH